MVEYDLWNKKELQEILLENIASHIIQNIKQLMVNEIIDKSYLKEG